MHVFKNGFQFDTPSKKENIFNENYFVKNHVFGQKSQISGIFKKSILHFKDALFRSSNHFLCECNSKRGQMNKENHVSISHYLNFGVF